MSDPTIGTLAQDLLTVSRSTGRSIRDLADIARREALALRERQNAQERAEREYVATCEAIAAQYAMAVKDLLLTAEVHGDL